MSKQHNITVHIIGFTCNTNKRKAEILQFLNPFSMFMSMSNFTTMIHRYITFQRTISFLFQWSYYENQTYVTRMLLINSKKNI